MFFAAALSIVLEVLLNMEDAEASLFTIASLHFLIAVLRADFLIVFFNVFVFVTSTLLIADLMFGKPFTSCDLFDFIDISYSTMKIFKMQGKYKRHFALKLLARDAETVRNCLP